MPLGLLGKKIGMTQIFDAEGQIIPVTLIEAGPCVVIQKRSSDKDGYTAAQIGFDPKKEERCNKPQLGTFNKAGVKPVKFVREIRGDETSDLEIGQELSVEIFEDGEKVDIVGTSKGRGFAGPRKRHGAHPGPKTHGSMYHNKPGALGGCADPSKTFTGKPMAGHYGNARTTVKNLTIVKADKEKNLLIVKGAIPGSNKGYVIIRKRTAKNGNGK